MSAEIKQILDLLLAHPGAVVAFLGTICASYGGVLAAGWRAASYLNKREIEDCRRQIGNLTSGHQRDLDRLAKQADAGALIDEQFPSIGELEPTDVPIGLPNAEYHRDFNVVLAPTPPAKLWVFEKSTLKEIFSTWFGSSLTDDPHLSAGYKLISGEQEASCLLWRGKSEVIIEDNPVMKQMYPFIIVRSIPHEAGADRTTGELLNFFDWLRMWDEAMPNAKFEILKMHRIQNKAYLRGYFRFTGLTIGESPMKPARKYDEYFLMRQVFVARSDLSTTIVATGLPNHELVTDPYYQPLKEWWEALRLVKTRVS
ncbi:hypothetical protein IVB18_05730 [Bradyrhizobium sp. 186]|uniref:hypothetical protein n=1 Tax=Bradyrhizobium sp. 186 TaxID=2782654 RepID=UPI00200140D3|nr:hypothetical protein [Bradyrhizobium sp. 186]UPK36847.1 hypothetical protein IVB18_05730 [Bradyrhizobium sp. 186]